MQETRKTGCKRINAAGRIQKTELINFRPKRIRTAEQTQVTISWIFWFHRCFDLNVATETNRLQTRSQDQ